MENSQNPFGWDVMSKPIYDHNGKVITSHKNICRDDNEDSIFVMGKRYEPLKNEELWNFAQKISEATGCNIKGHSQFKKGRVVMVQLENTKKDIIVAGHKMKSNIIVGNSFDGTRPIFLGCSDTYIRCSNQFGRILQTMTIRHSKQQLLKMEELVKEIGKYFNEYDALIQTLNDFSNVKLDDAVRSLLVNEILDVDSTIPYHDLSTRKKNQIEALESSIESEVKDLGGNLLGLFNGVTHFTTHKMKSKDDYQLHGTTALRNNKALSFCKAVMNGEYTVGA